MALKLDRARLLIADDVGVGKTVEACLVAGELLDRAEVRRFAVLCPPHLAEQWQRALREQFHHAAELVLSGTAAAGATMNMTNYGVAGLWCRRPACSGVQPGRPHHNIPRLSGRPSGNCGAGVPPAPDEHNIPKR